MSKEDLSITPPSEADFAMANERIETGKKLYEALVGWHSLAKSQSIDSPFELLDSTAVGFHNDIAQFQATERGRNVESIIVIKNPVRYGMDDSYIAVTNTGLILVLPSWLGSMGGENLDYTQVESMLAMKRKYNVCAGLPFILDRAVDYGHTSAVHHNVTDKTVQPLIDKSIKDIQGQLKSPFLKVPQPPVQI